MLNPKFYVAIAILSTLPLLAGACAQLSPTLSPALTPTDSARGTLKLYVTDAPPRDEVTSIMVTVAEVQVHKASAEQESEQEQLASGNQTQEQEREQQQAQQDGGEWISINISDNASRFDLLDVKGIEQFLGASEIEAGKYTQVRLVVDTVQVKLGSGNLTDATVPSGELKLVHPFEVVGGETTALVLDFAADKMVTVTGAGKILVKPVVKLSTKQEPGASKEDTVKEKPIEVSCNDFNKEQHIKQEAEVAVGDLFTVSLCSNPTTGFQWSESAQISDQTVLQQKEHNFIPPKDSKPPVTGAAGQEVWTFNVLKEGTSTISMEYSRPWQGGEKAEWTFELTVMAK